MPTNTGPAFGPFAAGVGASVGQDDYFDYLGPMLQGDGVNTTTFGGTSLQVFGNSSGLQVLVRQGSALVRGTFYRCVTGTVNLNVQPNSSGSTRIDRVVLNHDRAGGVLAPLVVMGTPGAGAPALTQAVGGTWQIPLAQVTVVSGATTINPGDVADERQYLPLKLAVCDTRYATPPPDGSQGRAFYDKNPSVMDLIVTNGTTWSRTSRPADSGWTAVTVPNFNIYGVGVRYRQVGSLTEMRGELGSSNNGSSDVAVGLPTPDRPLYQPVLCFSNQTGGVEAGWYLSLDTTEGRVQLHPPAGAGDVTNRNFSWQFTYFVG